MNFDRRWVIRSAAILSGASALLSHPVLAQSLRPQDSVTRRSDVIAELSSYARRAKALMIAVATPKLSEGPDKKLELMFLDRQQMIVGGLSDALKGVPANQQINYVTIGQFELAQYMQQYKVPLIPAPSFYMAEVRRAAPEVEVRNNEDVTQVVLDIIQDTLG